VPFVQNDVPPKNLRPQCEFHVCRHHHLVRRDHHINVQRSGQQFLTHSLPLVNVGSVQLENFQSGGPPFELLHPTGQHGQRNHHQRRTLDRQIDFQVGQKGDGLQCFTQSHFVGQDAIGAPLVHVDQPTDALQLVRTKLAPLNKGGSRRDGRER
jgi:hypothetical protein